MKRLLALLFSFALVIGLMPTVALGDPGSTSGAPSTTNAGQIVATGGTNPDNNAWHQGEGGGLVKVSKEAKHTGIENYFDITLTVDAKEVVRNTSTAVVIVMDASNTMNTNPGTGTRLANAKQAANQFIDEFCTGEGLSPDRHLGVVTFNTNAQWANGLTLQKVDASDASTLKNRVNAITTPSATSHDRFTNMEAGLQLAYNVLQTTQVANKYIIFITDGFPTTYINRTNDSNVNNKTTIKGWDPYETDPWRASKVGTDGYFADAVFKVECEEGTSYSDKAAIRARELAATMKSNNVNIFSVGIDIGGQTIKGYVDGSSSALSVVDRTGTKYEIGDADNSQAYAAWLGNSIAGGPKLTAQAHRYAAGNNPQQLATAFDNILNDIKAASSLPMTQALVTDPMGADVEFLYFHSAATGKPTQALNGTSKYYDARKDTPVDGNASFNTVNETITWDLLKSGFTVTQTDEADGARTVHYEIKYRVRLENENAGYAEGNDALTNNKAVFNYQTIEPDGSSTHNSPLAFPDPKVEGYKGEFSFTKIELNDEGNVKAKLSGAVFELKHNSAHCVECGSAVGAGDGLGKAVSISPLTATAGSDGAVKFENIPSGHDYILREVSAPVGYQLSGSEYPVKVSYDNTTVKVGDSWQTWVANPNDPVAGATISNTHLLPCDVDFVVSKSLFYGKDSGDPSSEGLEPEHEEFAFTLTEVNPIPGTAEGEVVGFTSKDDAYTETVRNHGEAAEFTPIHFGGENAFAPGTHYFHIGEVKGDDTDVLYDGSYYIARVVASGENVDHNMTHYGSEVTIWHFAEGTDLDKASLIGKSIYDSAPNNGTGNEVMAFANVKSKPATVTLPAISKKLDGSQNLPEGKFSFQLIDNDDNVLQTITNNAAGTAEFAPLTFDKAGTYTYTIKEVAGNDTSIYYDETAYKATVVVTAPNPNSGKPYTASVAITNDDQNVTSGSLPFANTTKTASLAMHATKIVDGSKLPTDGAYSFEVHAVKMNEQSNATTAQPAHILTGTNDGTGLVTFAPAANAAAIDGLMIADDVLTFTKAGVYHFHVSEVKGSDPSILYDSTVHDITVVVSDDKNQPTFSVTALDDGAEVDLDTPPATADIFAGSIDFSNVISKHKDEGAEGVIFPHFANSNRSASVSLAGMKTLDKKTPAEGAFSFVLKDADGNEIETVANDVEGRFAFAPIALNWDSTQGASNQHVYYISEVIGADTSISYDKTIYRVTVTLEDPALTDPGLPIPATVKYEQVLENGSYKTVESPDFNNKTKPAIPATGDSPLPWVLCGVAFTGLVLAFVAFRKTRKS